MLKILLAGCLLLTSQFAFAASLGEAEALSRGLQREEVRQLLDSRRDIALGQAQAAGRWANPEIEVGMEDADLPGGSVEERYFWVNQRFNLAGVHRYQRDAAMQLVAAENARTEYEQRELAAQIRRLFYTAVAADERAARIDLWRERFADLVVAVSRRAAAGDASRFDRLRLEKELALVDGDALDARAAAESARDRLFGLIGGEPAELQGRLLPPPVGPEVVAEALADHPLLRALDVESDAARLSSVAAERRSWPELTLGVGRRELTEPGTSADGNMLMLGFEIPLFDRGDGEARTASARSRRLASERTLAGARIAADMRAALRELEARRQAVAALREANADPADSLASIAESAYAAGELSVLELIDAHRTEVAAQLEVVARARAARESYIDIQLMRGEP